MFFFQIQVSSQLRVTTEDKERTQFRYGDQDKQVISRHWLWVVAEKKKR